jgi:hypothetical protein
MQLGILKIESTKPKDKPQKLADGNGLYLYNLRVEGCGGEYRLTTVSASITGTAITVELADEAGLLDAWRERIKAYVAECFMECITSRAVTIRLDGQVLPQNNDGIYDFAVITALGEVWYDEVRSNRSELVVTVAGLPMFVETVYSSANQSAVRYGQALDLSLNFANSSDLSARLSVTSLTGSKPSGESSAPLLLVCPESAKPEVADGYAAALGRITHERYPPNFHLKMESLSARRTAKSQAYITAPALVAEMNKQRSSKLAHSWRAALMTILCCDWALANGVAFHDVKGQLIDDWDSYGGELTDLQVYFRGRRVDAGFCFIANTEGLCSTPGDDNKPHRIYINPLLLTAETDFRLGDTLDLAYHEVSHLWEQHHGEAFCSVEGKLRQSCRRWLSEKALLARLSYAQTL